MKAGTTAHRRALTTACALGATFALAVLAGPPAPAVAPPPFGAQPAAPEVPGQDAIDQARRAADAKAGEVGRLQTAIDSAVARADAADAALAMAAEDFDQARVELQQRTDAAAAAAASARVAEAELSQRRKELSRIAVENYREGGNLGGAGTLLAGDGAGDALDRAALLQSWAVSREDVLARVESARAVASILRGQADAALSDQRAAADRARVARDKASSAADAAHAVRDQVDAENTRLVTQLATLRRTTVALEQQRQAGLQAQREAAERDAAARRAAERRRAEQERASKNRAERERAERERAERARAERDRQERERAEREHRDKTTPPTKDRDKGSGGSGEQPSGGSGGSQGSGSQGSGGSNSGGSGNAPSTPGGGSTRGSSADGRAAVAWAKTQIGKPYQWGADGPDTYDCSGLTMRAWQAAGVSLSHSSRYQYRQVRKIPLDQARVGDLLFWTDGSDDPARIHHVALYAGGGLMVEAPETGKNVRVVPIRYRRLLDWVGRP